MIAPQRIDPSAVRTELEHLADAIRYEPGIDVGQEWVNALGTIIDRLTLLLTFAGIDPIRANALPAERISGDPSLPVSAKKALRRVVHIISEMRYTSDPDGLREAAEEAADALDGYQAPAPADPEALVTYEDMVLIADKGVSKRQLERDQSEGRMPLYHVEGGGRKPHRWKWAKVRRWLADRVGQTEEELEKRFRRIRRRRSNGY